MSYLNGPRINFWGSGSVNVDTANNEQYDHGGSSLLNLSDASVTSDKPDAQIIDLLRAPATDSQSKPYYARGGWNYYGDHQVALMDAAISSCGEPGNMGTQSDLMGLPVYLLGSVSPDSGGGPSGGPVMVDLDPTSGSTTQIFAGGLLIGTEQKPTLLVRGDRVSHSRMISRRYDSDRTQPPYSTPGSAYISAIFQFSFHKSEIVRYDTGNALLKRMIEDSETQGIMLRLSLFQFFPGLDTDTLQKNYADNRNDANPSLGYIVGTLGPWYQEELATDPPGRLLFNPHPGKPGAQGSAWLDESANRLSLDLINALEGDTIRSQGEPHKDTPGSNLDYGELHVYAGHHKVGSVGSDPDGYFKTGGLYDLPLTREDVKQLKANLILIRDTRGKTLISEIPLRISSDQRNLYCDPEPDTHHITLRVEHLGQPLKSETRLSVTSGAPGTLKNGKFLDFPDTVTVSAGARSTEVKVKTLKGKNGFSALTFSEASASGASYTVNFRKYPEHDYSALIKSGEIPWETVYEECLRFFYVLFPAMSKRIPLNDEKTIRAVASEILKRTSDEYRDTTLYMPLTRALSPGKIELLRAFLKQSGSDASG